MSAERIAALRGMILGAFKVAAPALLGALGLYLATDWPEVWRAVCLGPK